MGATLPRIGYKRETPIPTTVGVSHRLPGECTSGTAATFDQARAEFDEAWRVFLSNRTDADFQESREQRAWTRWRYAMQDRGGRMPTQMADGRSRGFCGAAIHIGNY
jgi:hypothetical protein